MNTNLLSIWQRTAIDSTIHMLQSHWKLKRIGLPELCTAPQRVLRNLRALLPEHTFATAFTAVAKSAISTRLDSTYLASYANLEIPSNVHYATAGAA